MITFRKIQHSRRPNTEGVEILQDGVMVAMIYPNEEHTAIVVMSKHALHTKRDASAQPTHERIEVHIHE